MGQWKNVQRNVTQGLNLPELVLKVKERDYELRNAGHLYKLGEDLTWQSMRK